MFVDFLSDYRRMEETGNLNSGLLFYIFKSVTRCKYLDMLIEGRIGTRAGSEHYGQHDKENCMTWNWKNRDGATGRMEALQKRGKDI